MIASVVLLLLVWHVAPVAKAKAVPVDSDTIQHYVAWLEQYREGFEAQFEIVEIQAVQDDIDELQDGLGKGADLTQLDKKTLRDFIALKIKDGVIQTQHLI